MSKLFKSGLTASRKKRVRRRRTARPDVDQWDAMDDHCFRLQMMAELLRACGEPAGPGGGAAHRPVGRRGSRAVAGVAGRRLEGRAMKSLPDLAALKKTTDLAAVVAARGVKLKKQGNDYVGPVSVPPGKNALVPRHAGARIFSTVLAAGRRAA